MTEQVNEYEYFLKVHRGYTPARKVGLWRRRGEEAWEYLSLLDWKWHSIGEGGRVKNPPTAAALEPVSTQCAAELEADRQGWVEYWALYLDEADYREGVAPVTVVRRRSSPERVMDEAFVVGNKWAPDPVIYEFTHSRTDRHLEEITAEQAEHLIRELRGVTGATEL
ncbi:hypothetical protein LK07_24035 [Streptomyces pluripotens]|uniref:Uncharacterized protein n=1 Tax=Streptomyces pluripotens TaxID=1355015 RepID=A0A221P468_9ACTN|nr:hypothetical protein [Streptomyces pluripotens]ARP72325.1 hypothetical protein LK06_022870 [Streptomyces pluripotens]ASN26575.1 hypothetical protein LK07_24035 [Streptomyces pluripotens]